MRGLFCYRRGYRTLKSVPHVLIIHLFFIPLSATNYLQRYTNFPTSQRFYQKKHPEGCLSLVFHEFHSANQIVVDRLIGCCVTENEVQHGLTWFQHGFMVIESSTFRHRRLF